MAAFSELKVRERLLSSFIAQDPVQIQLQRPTYITTAAGGRLETGYVSLAAQTFYFQPFKRRLTKEYRYSPQSYGEEKVVDIDYILVFLSAVDIEVNDFFLAIDSDRLKAGRYTVEFISPRRFDRKDAGIRFRG